MVDTTRPVYAAAAILVAARHGNVEQVCLSVLACVRLLLEQRHHQVKINANEIKRIADCKATEFNKIVESVEAAWTRTPQGQAVSSARYLC